MLVLEYKVKAKPTQYKAIDEAIRTVQFIRNKCLRYWMDATRNAKIDRFALNKYSTELRNEFLFVKDLNSMAVQAAAERGWLAISRFYDNCKSNKPGKKGYPRFQKDNRSVEYKTSGWSIHLTKRRITITDKTSTLCCLCKRIVPKTLKDRIHSCECGCELHRDINAAINILLKAKSTGGHPGSNALGVAASTLIGEILLGQAATLSKESPRMRARGV